MNVSRTLTLLAVLTVLTIWSCTKDSEPVAPTTTTTIIEEPEKIDPQLQLEQDAASQFAIANSLIHEIFFISIRQAIQHPELFAFNGERIEDRAGCPSTQVLPDGGTGDTLVIDFGAGCTIPNGASDGPTVAGRILLISFGPLHTNANQFIQFDTVTVNGYDVTALNGSSSGIKFNNVLPNATPPFDYLFEARVTAGLAFVISSPNGDVSSILPQYSPIPFLKLAIVDNDPPLTFDFNDFLDANFEIELEPVTASVFRAGGNVDVFSVSKVPGHPLVYNPPCRWFDGGQLQFIGTVNQVLDYGYDLDDKGAGIPGSTCDGVVKVASGGSCIIVQCP